MREYETCIEKLICKTEALVTCSDDKKIKYLLEELLDENLRLKIDFFAFDYLRIFFKLSNISWVCLLISVLNEISNYDFDPIKEAERLFLNDSSKCQRYEEKKKLRRESRLFFLNKDNRIDGYIFNFLMSNGNEALFSNEFEIFFPREDFKIQRESEANELSRFFKKDRRSYVFIRSPRGMGKKTLAKKISFNFDKPIVIVDIEKCIPDENFGQIILSASRQSNLLGGFICFDNMDFISDKKIKIEIMLGIVNKLCSNIFFLSEKSLFLENFNFFNNSNVLEYKMKNLTNENLSNIWKEKLNDEDIEKEINFSEISNVFNFTPKQIDYASNLIKSCKSIHSKISKNQIMKQIRKINKFNFKNYAYPIETTNTWDDLIINQQDKNMIIDICKQRKLLNIVFEKWELGKRIEYGKGLSILFSGTPGTGKTMAAGIISRELGLDLYRVDLSQIVSKYIGETEKNISNLFEEAEKANCILLFDETDALFSQRTNVNSSNDRGANLEISHLLQRMEYHSGICILTTNYIENIDKAFFRRISYVFHFQKPNFENRKKIWRNMFAKAPLSDEIDFDFISKFDISGGNIKNIVVSSCFEAAQKNTKVQMKHIVKSIEYELKKQGYTPIKSEFGDYAYLL